MLSTLPASMSTDKKRPIEELDDEKPSKRPKTPIFNQEIDVDRRAEMLYGGKWSDFIITCQGQEFKVHRAIIAGHSEFLDKVLDGPFLESSTQRLDLPENDPFVVALALMYFYTGGIDFKRTRKLLGDNQDFSGGASLLLIQLHSLADQILAEPLKRNTFHQLAYILTEKYLSEEGGWTPPVTDEGLLFLQGFVRYVFTSTGVLPIIKRLVSWILVYLNTSVGLHKDELRKLADEMPELGIFLYETLLTSAGQDRLCCHCGGEFLYPFETRGLLVKVDDEIEKVSCRCLWQGLCSSMCDAEIPARFQPATCCSDCIDFEEAHILPKSRQAEEAGRLGLNRNRDPYLEDNKIKFKSINTPSLASRSCTPVESSPW